MRPLKLCPCVSYYSCLTHMIDTVQPLVVHPCSLSSHALHRAGIAKRSFSHSASYLWNFPSICYANTWSFWWNQQNTDTLSQLLSCWTQNSLIRKVISTINLVLNKQWPSTTFDLCCLLISCRGLGLHLYAVSEKSKGFIPTHRAL